MRLLVDREVERAAVAGLKGLHGAQQTLEFVVDVLVRAELHREAAEVVEARVRGVRDIDPGDAALHAQLADLAQDRREIVDLAHLGLPGSDRLADLRGDRHQPLDADQAGELVRVQAGEQLAAAVDGPGAALRGHARDCDGLRDDDLQPVRHLQIDHRGLHIGQLGVDAAHRGEAVDKEEVVALLDAGGVDDLLVRIALVSLHLHLCDAEEDGEREHQRRDHQEECERREEHAAFFSFFRTSGHAFTFSFLCVGPGSLS